MLGSFDRSHIVKKISIFGQFFKFDSMIKFNYAIGHLIKHCKSAAALAGHVLNDKQTFGAFDMHLKLYLTMIVADPCKLRLIVADRG
jgi:hypothetical protein